LQRKAERERDIARAALVELRAEIDAVRLVSDALDRIRLNEISELQGRVQRARCARDVARRELQRRIADSAAAHRRKCSCIEVHELHCPEATA
jgi:multidrug resistance efflux pump